MQATAIPLPGPVIAAWDYATGRYERVTGRVCVARWASDAIGHLAGSLCGDEVSKKVGDAWFCGHHYERALQWHHAQLRREREDDEAHGWNFESRRWDADAREIVYYMRRESDSLIKIGTTTRANARMGELRTEHGDVHLLLTRRPRV